MNTIDRRKRLFNTLIVNGGAPQPKHIPYTIGYGAFAGLVAPGASSINIPLPTNAIKGDVVFVYASVAKGPNNGTIDGFTRIASGNYGTTTYNISWFVKRLDGTEDASVEFTTLSICETIHARAYGYRNVGFKDLYWENNTISPVGFINTVSRNYSTKPSYKNSLKLGFFVMKDSKTLIYTTPDWTLRQHQRTESPYFMTDDAWEVINLDRNENLNNQYITHAVTANDMMSVMNVTLPGTTELNIPSTFSTEYAKVLVYANDKGYGLPDLEHQIIQDQYIKDYKTNGLWDQEERLWNIASGSGSREFALIDWKNPSDETSLIQVGTLDYDPIDGFSRGSGYLRTQWNIATAELATYLDLEISSRFSNDPLAVNIYTLYGATDLVPHSGSASGIGMWKNTNGYTYIRSNYSAANSYNTGDANGFMVVSNLGTSATWAKNGTTLLNATRTMAEISNELYILSGNVVGTGSTYPAHPDFYCNFFSIGVDARDDRVIKNSINAQYLIDISS